MIAELTDVRGLVTNRRSNRAIVTFLVVCLELRKNVMVRSKGLGTNTDCGGLTDTKLVGPGLALRV